MDDERLGRAVNGLDSRIHSAISRELAPEETILWTGRPIPKHAWTIIGTTFPRTRNLRAISLIVFEACGLAILGLGLVLMIGFGGLLQEFGGSVAEVVGLLLLGPIAIVVIGAGCQAIMTPLRIYRWAVVARYVLTTHHAFIAWTLEDEVRVDKMALSRVTPPDVFRMSENGVGDVIFATQMTELVGGDSDTTTAWSDRGFFAVANAKELAVTIEHARAERCLALYGLRGYGLDERPGAAAGRAS